MIKELEKIAKNLRGSVLVIGFTEDDKIIKNLNKNKKLTVFSHLTDNSNNNIFKSKKKKFFGNKTINVKKLYKELKKEKYDYIICEFNLVKANLDNFIRNSYRLTNETIYFIVDEIVYDAEEIRKRYVRYNAKGTLKTVDDECLLTIDVSMMQMSLLKRFLYRFRDIGYNIVEFISNVIIS